ncbi:hypothetical protein SCATT_p12870 (plasmid) [Streptantibioticus cattleyicolor NRRL 8057 = DSM 46488]|uniref:Uncharacterized protein n=1 Tax=Streptantibioticus cattleyicolor (strain ATCC 35852 / DSM 46488 / JCM 4925 / NBRC 14057 / NRRL 8057) TaxID=1003195 RepID=G8XFL9_STREN|nr:hypothetical protein SCATT_p12870 [Streptantibioticus cattleyicolor NRRL 8057 = DSM 46488]
MDPLTRPGHKNSRRGLVDALSVMRPGARTGHCSSLGMSDPPRPARPATPSIPNPPAGDAGWREPDAPG